MESFALTQWTRAVKNASTEEDKEWLAKKVLLQCVKKLALPSDDEITLLVERGFPESVANMASNLLFLRDGGEDTEFSLAVKELEESVARTAMKSSVPQRIGSSSPQASISQGNVNGNDNNIGVLQNWNNVDLALGEGAKFVATQLKLAVTKGFMSTEDGEKMLKYLQELRREQHKKVVPPLIESAKVVEEAARDLKSLEDALAAVLLDQSLLRNLLADLITECGQRLQHLKEGHAVWLLQHMLKDLYLKYKIESLGSGARTLTTESVFVKVQVAEFSKEVEEAALKGNKEGMRKAMQDKMKPIAMEELFSDQRRERIMIQGEAGAGKTTLLMQIAHKWATGKLWNDKYDLIVYSRLRNVDVNQRKTLEDVLASGLLPNEQENFKLMLKWSERDGNNGRVLYIFDGWDEIVLRPGSVLEKIQQGFDGRVKYMIAGSRPEAVAPFQSLTDLLVVQGFTEAGVGEFLSNYPFSDPKLHIQVAEVMSHGTWLKDACRLPLMLGLVCLVAGTLTAESRRCDIYKMVVDFVLKRFKKKDVEWNESEQGLRGINIGEILRNLYVLAWDCFRRKNPIVTEDTISLLASGDDKMIAIVEKCGLLKSEGLLTGHTSNCFVWVHFTILEYLAACCVCGGFLGTPDVGAELSKVRSELGATSDVFFAFVCGIKGKGFECLERWYPKELVQGKVFDDGPVEWIEEGGDELEVFLLEHWKHLYATWRWNWMLWATSKGGFTRALKFVLAVNATGDISVQDKNGWSALHWSSVYGHTTFSELLLSKGANIELVDKLYGWTPLHYASYNGQCAVVELLIAKKGNIEAVDKDGATPLHAASDSGHSAIVELLIAKGANIEATDKNCSTPVHYASWSGQTTVVEMFSSKGANLEAVDDYDSTPLHWACENGHYAVVELLLSKGANIEAIDKEGATPLHYASDKGLTAVVELLISRGAVIEAVDTKEGATPLHYASWNGQTAVVELLLSKGAKKEAFDHEGATPLHYASDEGHTAVVDLLVSMGVNIDACDWKNATPLHYASDKGHYAVVEFLISKGAHIQAVDEEGSTPLDWASEKGHLTIVELLSSKGANSEIDDEDVSGSSSTWVIA